MSDTQKTKSSTKLIAGSVIVAILAWLVFFVFVALSDIEAGSVVQGTASRTIIDQFTFITFW